MSFYNDTTNIINGQIATLKTVSNKTNSKYKQTTKDVNNLMDSIMEIYNQLGGYQDMIKSIEDILSTKLEDIEEVVKSAIKIALKQIISCGIEPTIGDELIVTGVTFDIKKIDPLTIFGIDPTSESGSYAYFDNNSGINSVDFNVFLYTIIQESVKDVSYNGADWNKIEYDENNNKVRTPLFRATFKEYDELTQKSNQLTIKINESLKGQKLSYFISEYLDTVKLFNNIQVISSIFDDILSAKIISINKTTEQIAVEKLISNLVDKMINSIDEDEDVIDDSFYVFSNDVYNQMLEESENKRNGIFVYNTVLNGGLSIDQELLLDSLNDLKMDGLLISQQTKILTDTVDAITKDLVDKGSIKNQYSFSFKFDFIKKIITKLTTTITTFIFSPKIIYLFSMTAKLYKIDDPDDAIEFIKSNINIYKIIIIKIRDIIAQILIDKIKEMLIPLITKVTTELIKEKFSIYKKQIDGIKDAIESAFDIVSDITNKVDDSTIMDKADIITSNIN